MGHGEFECLLPRFDLRLAETEDSHAIDFRLRNEGRAS